jgi:TonB family protein
MRECDGTRLRSSGLYRTHNRAASVQAGKTSNRSISIRSSEEHKAMRNPDITLFRDTGTEFRNLARPSPLPQPSWTSVIIITAVVAGITWAFVRDREPAIDPRQIIAVNLVAARLALEDGRYLTPPEHSALHYYSTVLTLDPDNGDALKGKKIITDSFIEKAKGAILDGQFAEAASAIESIRRIQPSHRRLAYLEAELSKGIEQHVLSIKAQESLVQQAATLEATKQAPISTAMKDQPTARLAHEGLAHERLAHERSIARSDQVSAPRDSTEGRVHLGGVPDLRAAQEKVTPPVRSLESAEKSDVLTESNGLTADEMKDYELIAGAYAAARSQIVAHGNTVRAAQPEMQPVVARKLVEQTPPQPVPIEPKVIKLVEPEYPQAARVRGMEGWVDLTLLVTPTGDVLDARVEESNGSRSFERAALNAVRQWKYQPVMRTSNEDVSVRVAFKLED